MSTNRTYQDMAPGLEQVIQAGDTLVIRDSEGQEFAVTARESDLAMEFIKAFDKWLTTKNAGIKGVVLDAAWFQVEQAYRNLPVRIAHELPSWTRPIPSNL